jgi:molybdopterin converting factor subunit 1
MKERPVWFILHPSSFILPLMILYVRLFARARDLAGADTLTVELAPGSTVADLRRRLAALHPALAPLLERSALAVEHEFATADQPLKPEAEVALLPPVSGGSVPLAACPPVSEFCATGSLPASVLSEDTGGQAASGTRPGGRP